MHKWRSSALGEIVERVAGTPLPIYAAAAVYCSFIALVPALMLMVSLVRYLPFSQSELLDAARTTLPHSVYQVVGPLVAGIYRGGGTALTVSILLTVFTASGVMRALMKGLDAVYGVRRRDSLPVFFLRAAVYMALLMLLMLLSLILLVFTSQLWALMGRVLPDSVLAERILSSARVLRTGFTMAILTLAFLLLYRWVPAGEHHSDQQWPGAVFCALAWVAFSWLYSLYLSVSDRFGAYGYLGTVMVSMMWVYYCVLFILVGGCVNAWVEERARRGKETKEREDKP